MKDLLNTQRLGDSVGRSLNLGEVMRWMPAVVSAVELLFVEIWPLMLCFFQADGQKGPKETGLYRIRGVAVEALLGAIYHQHGAQAAKGFFSSKVLPMLDTYTEQEAETLKGAIANESQVGEGILRNLAAGSKVSQVAGMRTEKDTIESVDATLLADDGSETSFNESSASRTQTSTMNPRRRRLPTSTTGLPLEEDSNSSRPSEGRTIA